MGPVEGRTGAGVFATLAIGVIAGLFGGVLEDGGGGDGVGAAAAGADRISTGFEATGGGAGLTSIVERRSCVRRSSSIHGGLATPVGVFLVGFSTGYIPKRRTKILSNTTDSLPPPPPPRKK